MSPTAQFCYVDHILHGDCVLANLEKSYNKLFNKLGFGFIDAILKLLKGRFNATPPMIPQAKSFYKRKPANPAAPIPRSFPTPTAGLAPPPVPAVDEARAPETPGEDVAAVVTGVAAVIDEEDEADEEGEELADDVLELLVGAEEELDDGVDDGVDAGVDNCEDRAPLIPGTL